MAERVILKTNPTMIAFSFRMMGQHHHLRFEAQSDYEAANASTLIASMPIYNAFHETTASPVFQWPSSTIIPTDTYGVLSHPLPMPCTPTDISAMAPEKVRLLIAITPLTLARHRFK